MTSAGDSDGWPRSVELFAPVTWTGTRPADSFAPPGDEYPGTRPDGSYVVEAGMVRGLDPIRGGWVERDSGEPFDLVGRHLVLAYGANGDPVRVTHEFGDEPIPVLRCLMVDRSAVWSAGRRTHDGAVVATIAPDPGRVEVHHLVGVNDAQFGQMDRWEGHPKTYERQALGTPILLENGEAPSDVWCYVGTPERRPPLIVAGEMMRLAEYDQRAVDPLVAQGS